MPETIVRKCTGCKGVVEINRNNIADVIYYNKVYYHKSCFCELAEKRSQSKRGKYEEWKKALDNIIEIEMDTKNMLQSAFTKDDLNEWLLSNYDIAAVPSRFWQIAADLERGTYKGKKCRQVSIGMLVDMWKWGQNRLNKIASKNKTNHMGPQNDTDRLRYDLSILIGHIGDYIKYTTRTKEESVEIKNRVQTTNKINYENLNVQPTEKQNDNNILDLMNDIF